MKVNTHATRKGFTLTEILIVLVIAGILLALILPNSLKAIERGNVTAGKSNIQSCSTAVLMCFSENGQSWNNPHDCTDVNTLVDLKYLKEVGLNDATPPVAVSVVQDPVTLGYICQ